VPLAGDWVGTLDGLVNAQIQPQVSGYLVHQNYREGSSVAKDQVLFQIDRRQFQAAVDQAAAQVDQAKGQLAQARAQQSLAQINQKRDTPLALARAIAQSQLDNDTQQAEQADAAVAAAKAAVRCRGSRTRYSQSEPGLHGSPISRQRHSGPGHPASR
jgi:membrane fusion protein (multidrug efflux system)